MASERPQTNSDRLPIKLILPRQGSESRVSGGGGPKVPFRTVDAAFRQRLHKQLDSIRTALAPHIERTGSAPVKVRLLRKASAKSHRPDTLFSDKTCPIIGNGALGELFVRATPDGLTALADQISGNTADKIVKELSCVESIEPISPQERRRGRDPMKTAPVYDEMAKTVRNRFKAENMTLRNAVRVATRAVTPRERR